MKKVKILSIFLAMLMLVGGMGTGGIAAEVQTAGAKQIELNGEPVVFKRITEYRYRDTEFTESRETSMEGWEQHSSKWVKSSGGSKKYASFPAGYDTSHSFYKNFARSKPYSPSETETAKREVSTSNQGYIYWHWMYDTEPSSNYLNRAIYYKNAYGSAVSTGNEYYYQHFQAFTSTKNYPYVTGNWNQGEGVYKWYNCSGIYARSSFFYRFNYYDCTYTDYYKLFTFKKVSDWSEWSSEPVEQLENREIESQELVVYMPQLNCENTTVDLYSLSDVVVTTVCNGNTFSEIEGLTKGTDYTVSGDTVTVSKDYLTGLTPGNAELNFIFNKGEESEVSAPLTLGIIDSTPIDISGFVTISGNAVRGGTLMAVTENLLPEGVTYTYAWNRNAAPIDGATASTYSPTAQDVGQLISVSVIANGDFTGTLTSAPVTVSCVHDYTWSVTRTATCTAEGEKLGICVCGDTKTETIPETEHNYGAWRVTLPATCIAVGSKIHTCLSCGKSETAVIEKDSANHTGGTVIRNTIEVTCRENGYSGDTYCLGCGAVIAQGSVINASGHIDADNDGSCDECGEFICDCACHTECFIVRLFWKIKVFFYKLFGMENRHYCACGNAHW